MDQLKKPVVILSQKCADTGKESGTFWGPLTEPRGFSPATEPRIARWWFRVSCQPPHLVVCGGPSHRSINCCICSGTAPAVRRPTVQVSKVHPLDPRHLSFLNKQEEHWDVGPKLSQAAKGWRPFSQRLVFTLPTFDIVSPTHTAQMPFPCKRLVAQKPTFCIRVANL